ncbi:MAG: hypothetical protein J3K34DRAFT_523561 [Monoraphidium minutum]|nr:MAG: hypothetical protein J3K34DRAFT_523561 [Monoraphidium minutum]
MAAHTLIWVLVAVICASGATAQRELSGFEMHWGVSLVRLEDLVSTANVQATGPGDVGKCAALCRNEMASVCKTFTFCWADASLKNYEPDCWFMSSPPASLVTDASGRSTLNRECASGLQEASAQPGAAGGAASNEAATPSGASPAPLAQRACPASISAGIDFYGGDLPTNATNAVPPQATLDECCLACEAARKQGCRAFTYITSSAASNVSRCWLKTLDFSPSEYEGVSSGILP